MVLAQCWIQDTSHPSRDGVSRCSPRRGRLLFLPGADRTSAYGVMTSAAHIRRTRLHHHGQGTVAGPPRPTQASQTSQKDTIAGVDSLRGDGHHRQAEAWRAVHLLPSPENQAPHTDRFLPLHLFATPLLNGNALPLPEGGVWLRAGSLGRSLRDH